MKIIVFLLIILGVAIGASQYLQANPLNVANRSATSRNTQENPDVSPASCNRTPIRDVTEGPYYKQGSPERTNIREGHNSGTPLTLTGSVMDENCNPIAGAWIDFWQADENGDYDNQGFILRGHQLTDTQGKYSLTTVIPGEYPGRTPHIHVKVRANENSPITTTQLFIPGVEKNQSDTLYDDSLLVDIKDRQNGVIATYNFVIKTQ